MVSATASRRGRRVRATFGCLCLLLIPPAGIATAAPAHRALLIAINEYASPDIPRLAGPHNDVEMIRKLLVTRFDFQESEVTTILDGQATRAGILAALRNLAQKSGPDDIVYIHYSGHGSQVKDVSGDEPDGLDQTLVPYDGRTGETPDVIDDELAEILGGLRTEHALVIIDACHSGTATRSVAIRTRAIPMDTRTQLYVRPSSRAIVVVPPMRHVLMTGASRSEPALDGPIEGQSRGFFSYALGRVLTGAPGPISPNEIHAGVKVVFRSLQEQLGAMSVPEPQVEGSVALLARPVLTMARQSGRASVEARPDGPGRIQLMDGLAMGAAPGSRWAIYPPGERAFEPGRALATARVTGGLGKHATAVPDPADAAIPAGARGILISTAPPAGAIPVLLRAPDGLKAGLETAVLKRLSSVRFVAPAEFARFLVEVTDASQGGGGTHVNVYGAGGLQLLASFTWTEQDSAADRLVALFARNANAAALKSLTNPASRMQLSVKLVTAGTGDAAQRGLAVVPADNVVYYRTRKAGEARTAQNSLMLQVQADRDCYLTIVDVDADGGVVMLFPNAQQGASYLPGGRIRAGEGVRIPDAIDETNRAGFFWDYSPPTGPDVIQVFATTDLESTQKLRGYIEDFRRQGGARGLAAVSQRGLSATPDPLDRLRGDLARLATERGVRVVATTTGEAAAGGEAATATRESLGKQPTVEPRDWTSVPLTIEVTE